MNKKVLAIVLILAVMLTIVPTGSANAACSGSGCTGLDPSAQGCTSDAQTVGSYTGSGSSGTVTGTLMYSPTCVANWAKATTSSGSRYVRAEVTVYGYQYRWAFGSNITVLSYMLDGHAWHCAVGFVDTNNDTYYDTFSGSSSLAAKCG